MGRPRQFGSGISYVAKSISNLWSDAGRLLLSNLKSGRYMLTAYGLRMNLFLSQRIFPRAWITEGQPGFCFNLTDC